MPREDRSASGTAQEAVPLYVGPRLHKEVRLLRVGVLGAGPIAQHAHFESVRKAKNAELYAICDVAEDLLQTVGTLHDPKVLYADYDEMLSDPDVEAVVVAVSDQFHVPLALKAVEAGKHVFVEKPMGVGVEEAEALRDAAKEKGVLVQVGFMRRYDPGVAYAKRFVDEEMGEMLALKAWYCDSAYRYTLTDNLLPITLGSERARKPEGDPKADRRRYYVLGHGSHLLDFARFMGGEIASVRARLVEKFGAYCWLISVDYENGAAGQLDLTIAVKMDWHEGFQIYGERGSVLGKSYLPWYDRASDVECFSVEDGVHRRPLGEDSHMYRLQVEGLARRVFGEDEPYAADAADGVASTRLMVALARSAETGEAIRPDEVTGEV